MQSVQVGMWDPHPPPKQHDSPLAPSQRRLSHVSAPPAKRITFYKSGDSQFSGVKMAVHKRSFKCFDALLDDLSQKMPLPFGVRTVTTPRGTHTISHLEQLQDGGCYLCSDRRQTKPINMEIATKQAQVWSHHSRRPHRPDSSSATPPGHVPYRQRRLLLVKNTEPSLRRSVVLSRRVSRSLRAFLEEASEVMQFHVRKLYTVEGRKIDNVQNLMTWPNVLVCVGREAFSPLLVNYVRKSSGEKLPGLGTRTPGNGARSPPLGAQSRASENSEGTDTKKNSVNFGLETKKSIIHPRSDSSTRSGRYSLSSEKSYGLSTVSQGRAAILNDDIEKRVVVNKDGSLSVEMRVRFRLHSDETLQWSTRIKKSPSLTNDLCSEIQEQPHYLQQESCSDPECNSFIPETANYPTHGTMDVSRCPCCYQKENQYDLWENPAHSHKQPVPPPHATSESHTILRHTHSSCSSSSCSSTRVVRCRARLTNGKTESSQIVQEEMCVTEQHTLEQDVCSVSHSCSRSDVVVNGEEELSCKSGKDVERPVSALSASSHVLQELKEDDDEELPPSASRCSGKLSPTDDKLTSTQQNSCDIVEDASTCQCNFTSEVEVNERAASCKSTKKMTMDEVEEVSMVLSELSTISRQSATSLCTNCGGWKAKKSSECNSTASKRLKSASPILTANEECCVSVSTIEDRAAEEVRAVSASSSHHSNTSRKDEERTESRSPSVISAKSDPSTPSAVSDLTVKDEADKVASAMSAKSSTSPQTSGPCKSTIKVTPPSTAEDEDEICVASEQSNKCVSAKESRPASAKSSKYLEESRPASGISVKSMESAISAKSSTLHNRKLKKENAEEDTSAPRILSAQSNDSGSASPMSIKSDKSSAKEIQNLEVKSIGKGSRPGSGLSVKSARSDVSKKSEKTKGETRSASKVSVKSNATGLSVKSHVSEKSVQDEIKTKGDNHESDEVKSNAFAIASRPASVLSVKSNNSQRSPKNEEQNEDVSKRTESAMSSQSNPTKECRPGSGVAGKLEKSCEKDMEETRTASAMSSKSSIHTEKGSLSPRLTTKLNGSEKICYEEKQVERSTSSKSSKSSLSVKSSTSASPAKEKEEERALSPSSGKSQSSITSAKSKKSKQGVIYTDVNMGNDNKSERLTSPVSVKSGTSRVFHVITIKTPEVVTPKRPASSSSAKTNDSSCSKENRTTSGEKDDAYESLVEDQVSKSETSKQSQELIPKNVDQRGSSSLSVLSDKSGKSSKSKCNCGKKKEKDQAKEESELAANVSSPKKDDYEDDSFASVSLVLPEDPGSESGESNISSNRNKSTSVSPEVSKNANNVDIVERNSQSNSIVKDIPNIETALDNNKDSTDKKMTPTSSCSAQSSKSVKSSKSKKSCSSCGKLKIKTGNGNVDSPIASEKSIATSKTGQLTAPDDRTGSAMSGVSAKSQRKLAKCEEIEKDGEESCEQASEDKEERQVARTKSKSPCRLRPTSSGSNKSKLNSSKTKNESVQSVKSSHSKEGIPQNVSRPASKGDTCSESILSNSLSAADLLKEANPKLPESPRSKCSKSSARSAKCQRSKKEAVPELTPSCLPNASPAEVVSDWLKSIPANVQALGEEEGLTDKIGEGMDGENSGAEEEDDKGAEEAKEGEKKGPNKDGKLETFKIRQKETVTDCSLPNNWHPSATVMKVLLSSSLGRCRSMPEVSPVYGRRLSTSAKDLLDCLTQLQLIEPAGHQGFSVQKEQHQPQFQDIISILQSLWLNEPRDIIANPKDTNGADQVSPPRSSSGVGMSSGSAGSGKENGNQEDVAKDEETEVKTEEVPKNPDSPKVSDNPSSSYKNSKSPTDNELDPHEGSSAETPPNALRAPFTKRQSQDPDPVWVVNLLKKLEKQFIDHYVEAMGDFKAKWDLEDSLILDRMIVELKDDVSQRIEKSVDKEMKKIKGRAGKGAKVPRPPKGTIFSQDSTMTEKRRQRLMVMKKQSVQTGDSVSEGELTADNSDQRSEDEYCPCEACVRKKMAARPFKTNPTAIEPPIQMEFDLLKILQLKKTPAPAVTKTEEVQEEANKAVEEDCRNLEVVQEEEEEEESKDESETGEGLDAAMAKENIEEDKCQCHCSENDSDDQTEDSDKETVREKSIQNEIVDEPTEEEKGGDEDTTEEGESKEVSTEERASDQVSG